MNPFAEEAPPVPATNSLSIPKDEAILYKDSFIKLQFQVTGSTAPATVDKVVLKPDSLLKYLASSELPSTSLSKVWELAGGTKRNGLGLSEFQIACKLIALAQNELQISLDLLSSKCAPAKYKMPLPDLPGLGPGDSTLFSTPARTSTIGGGGTPFYNGSAPSSSSSTAAWMPVQRTGTSAIIPTSTGSFQGLVCTPEEKAKFTSFFENSGPVDGYLSGNTAKDIFLKSQLGPETLGKVWALIDKDGLGKFSLNHFCVGMWIITKIKVGLLKEVPGFIPPSLWTSIASSSTDLGGGAASSPLISSLKSTLPIAMPVAASSNIASLIADMTDADRAQYKSFFESLDTGSKGSLTGAECSSVFLKSKLPAQDLATVWDLVDTRRTGSIDREHFAMAMHIIKKRIGGAPLPASMAAATTPAVQTESLLDFSTPSLTSVTPAVKPNLIPTQPQPSDADLLQGLSLGGPRGTEKVVNKAMSPRSTFNPSLSSSLPQQPLPSSSITASPANPILLPKAATAVSSSLEARDLEAKEKNLQIRHQELSAFQSQLQELKPNAEEIKKRREQVDQEYRSVTEKRNQVSIELSQLRAEYELDLETLRDRQNMLEGDRKTLAAAQNEIVQYKEAISLIKKENANLRDKIDSQKKELTSVLKTVSELEGETASLRQATHQLFDEARQQQVQMDYHNKVLETGRQEHDIVKKNLEIEQGRLESDKKKVQQLEQQASVQQAIIEKEKLRMETMERERLENAKRSQDLMGSIQSMEAEKTASKNVANPEDNPLLDSFASEQSHRPSLRDQILATAVSSENIVIPVDQPAPPIPPASTKPLKGSSTNLVDSSSTPKPAAAVADSTSSSVFPTSTTSAASAGTPASNAKTPASVFSVESSISKKERDSMDLDSLLSSNKPKTEKASVAVAAPSSTNVDFDSFFASAPTQQKAKPPPAPSSSSTNAVLSGGSGKGADAASVMEKAFASASLKQAKDTPSLASDVRSGKTPTSAGGSAILSTPAFSSANNAAVSDSFSFDGSFTASNKQANKPPTGFPPSTNESFGVNFNKTVDADFGNFKAPKAFPSEDLDSVFGGGSSTSKSKAPMMDSDPFGQSAFVPSGNGEASTALSNDPFGGFGSNPFDAFNTPFPPPTFGTAVTDGQSSSAAGPSTASPAKSDFQTVANSSSKGMDSPEVANIVSMGFTKEQAMNSLEAHGWNVERAINYLLESGGG